MKKETLKEGNELMAKLADITKLEEKARNLSLGYLRSRDIFILSDDSLRITEMINKVTEVAKILLLKELSDYANEVNRELDEL